MPDVTRSPNTIQLAVAVIKGCTYTYTAVVEARSRDSAKMFKTYATTVGNTRMKASAHHARSLTAPGSSASSCVNNGTAGTESRNTQAMTTSGG